MRVRRRISLALVLTKSPIQEDELSFIQSLVQNNLGEILKHDSKSLLIAFGSRKTRESDIERSLSVCLEIKDHILGSKFGVSYGLVSIDEKKDGTIKVEGKLTKKVQHLNSIAQRGQISVDDSISKIYSRIFDIRHVKADDKDVYNVFGFKDKPTRIRGLREAYGKLVGRDKEFDQLQNLLLEIASSQGQIVGVVGEAGIGKTRLTHELKTLLKMRGLKFFEGSFPYFGGSSYKGFVDLISSIANINVKDPISSIEQKLRRIGGKYKLENADVNFLVNLYSIVPVEETIKHLNEEQLRLGTFVAVKKLIFAIAEDPLIIILEDMQNADELSANLADFLAEGLPDRKLLFFMNYRPEFKGKFEEKIYFNRIKLERFDELKAKEFLSSLLDISHIPKNLLRLIYKKSAGNPLYIEELVRSLLDKGKIKVINNELKLTDDIKTEDIQPTVHGVISYRMEKLPIETRKVLKWASAIGDEINIKLLKTILSQNRPPSLEGRDKREGEKNISQHIELLEERDFIVEKSIYPEEIYKFRHDLIREVAYESLPSSLKKNIHLKIGNYLEKKFKREIDEHVEEIANHYINSSDHNKGFEFALKAAEKLKKNYSNERAEKLFIEAMNLLNKVILKEKKEELRLNIIEALKDIYIMGAKFKQAFSTLKIFRNQTNLNNQEAIAAYHRMKGEIHWRQGFNSRAITSLNIGLQLAEKLTSKSEEIKSLNLLLAIYSVLEDADKTHQYANRLLKMSSFINRNIEANIYHRLGIVYLRQSSFNSAIDYFKKSASIFEESKDHFQSIIVYNNLGRTFYCMGNYKDSIYYLKLALQISREIGNIPGRGDLYNNLANAYIALGNMREGYNEYCLAENHFGQSQSIHDGIFVYSNLAWFHFFVSDYKVAREYLAKSKKLNSVSPFKLWESVNKLLEAKIENKGKNYQKSIDLIYIAIEIFEALKDRSHIAEALTELADVYYQTKQSKELEQQIAKLDELSGEELSILTKERIFTTKLKANLVFNSINEDIDHSLMQKIDNFDFENKFDAYISLAKYFRDIKKDTSNFRIFLNKAIEFYKSLSTNIPDNLVSNFERSNFFKICLAELE